MSLQLRQHIETVWTRSIGLPPDLTAEEIDRFLDRETETISALIEQGMGTAQGPTIAQWKAEHNGQEPDYPTKVALINTARLHITEQVLQQNLYEKIPPEPDDPTPQEALEIDRGPERWRDPLSRSEPTPELEKLTDQWFPAKSTLWRVMLAYLLQSMDEDGATIPTGPQDPAMATVVFRLEAAMMADGQPLDGPGALAP
ncbi:hypothetical protein OG874_35720 [Nocardia sp. NBC_00565]|uniref:hypothetical protein n=1 Tax=Nocardia sp. NBC_00565 TaxID=2975993 RepID=UPI002E8122A1|nr:hypothetical protein [Nocardia sp. NBC_00565]WUC02040.1 hypothetical protein OG874_35720 [Nocardia sp. NBC_00565]